MPEETKMILKTGFKVMELNGSDMLTPQGNDYGRPYDLFSEIFDSVEDAYSAIDKESQATAEYLVIPYASKEYVF